MLAADPLEAIEQSRAYLKEGTIAHYYDDILLGALRLAQADAELGRLDNVRLENIFQTVTEVVEDLGHSEFEHDPSIEKDMPSGLAGENIFRLSSEQPPSKVICLAGLGRLDDCAAVVVADLLKRLGIAARPGTSSDVKADESSICICYLENISEARIGYASRKLSRQAPAAKIVFALLGQNSAPATTGDGAQITAQSLEEAAAAFANFKMPRVLSPHR